MGLDTEILEMHRENVQIILLLFGEGPTQHRRNHLGGVGLSVNIRV